MNKTTVAHFFFLFCFTLISPSLVVAQENHHGMVAGVFEQGGLEANATPKYEWPEVVGLPAEEAEVKIKQDRAEVHIQVIPADHFSTMDYNHGRVRIWLDATGKV